MISSTATDAHTGDDYDMKGLRKIPWDEGKEYITSGELWKLCRTEEMTYKYQAFKKKIELKNLDFTDVVMGKLNWSMEQLTTLNDKKYPSDNDKINASFADDSLYKLTINDFPYNFEQNVHHLLIWSKIKLPIYLDDDMLNEDLNSPTKAFPTKNLLMKERIDIFLLENLEKKFGFKKKDYFWFINYSKLQSIRGISHIHLMIRSDDMDLEEKIFDANFNQIR